MVVKIIFLAKKYLCKVYSIQIHIECCYCEACVIDSFADKDLEVFFRCGKLNHHKGWAQVASILKRKLDMLDYAKELIDLRSPPNNRLEKLKSDLEGFYSIRVNDQWRVIFKWNLHPYDVSVVDYH